MPMIEVGPFTCPEKRLLNAAVAQDRALLESLLPKDFELRTARSGGGVTVRDTG
jgi:hypothetical protein